MTANQSRLLGVALLLSAVAAIMRLGGSGDASDGAPDPAARSVPADTHNVDLAVAQSRARFEAGAYIAGNKRISDSEEIQTVVIPEGHTEELDTRCIVYKNSELRTSSITCSGVLFRQPAPPS